MNLNLMVGSIQRRLGFRSDLVTVILDNASIAQERIELVEVKTKPWFLLSETANTNATILDERVSLPTGFLGEAEQSGVWVTDSDGADKQLTKGPYDRLKEEYTGSGLPVAYSLLGNYYRLHPKPDVAYGVKIFFFKKATAVPSVLTGNESFENQWMLNAPSVLENLTGALTAKDIQNTAREVEYMTAFEAAKQELFLQIVAREAVNNERTPEDVI